MFFFLRDNFNSSKKHQLKFRLINVNQLYTILIKYIFDQYLLNAKLLIKYAITCTVSNY